MRRCAHCSNSSPQCNGCLCLLLSDLKHNAIITVYRKVPVILPLALCSLVKIILLWRRPITLRHNLVSFSVFGTNTAESSNFNTVWIKWKTIFVCVWERERQWTIEWVLIVKCGCHRKFYILQVCTCDCDYPRDWLALKINKLAHVLVYVCRTLLSHIDSISGGQHSCLCSQWWPPSCQ